MAETALILPVLHVEPLVGEWRRSHTPSGADGMAAHVTLLVPFADTDALTDELLARVAETLGAFDAFEAHFRTCAYFPDVLYLVPSPEERFRELIGAVLAAFPEHPPYGGSHPDPVPHLTVATGPREELEPIERAVTPGLPIHARIDEAWLVAHEPEGWRPRHAFRLRTSVESNT